MKITTLGIDISNNVFQLHGGDTQGKVVLTTDKYFKRYFWRVLKPGGLP